MNKLIIIAAALVGAVVILCPPIKAEGSRYAETVINEKADKANARAAYDADSLFHNRTAENAQCYRCSAPCSNTSCCPDEYPQCCYITDWDLCGCCSV